MNLTQDLTTAAKLPPLLNVAIPGSVELTAAQWNLAKYQMPESHRISGFDYNGIDCPTNHAAFRQRSIRAGVRWFPVFLDDRPEDPAPTPPQVFQCETHLSQGRDLVRCTATADYGYRWGIDAPAKCCRHCRSNLEAAAVRIERTLHVWVLQPKERC